MAGDAGGEEGLSLLAPRTWFLPTSPAGPQQAHVTVNAPAGMAWTASASDSWIDLGGGASGQGPGVFTFSVGDNPGAMRQGTLTVGDQVLHIVQLSSPTWQDQQVLSAPLPYIEQVGLEGFLKQFSKLPPPARAAALLALEGIIAGVGVSAATLYAAFPNVPEHFTPDLIKRLVAQAEQFVLEHAGDS
jgi:hypothetical protein